MPDTTVRIPAWADPNNASVLDNWWTRTARTLGGFLGAADPTSQAMAIGAPVELPSPGQGAAKMTLKAYHGSPHDFDQFSLGKIGTGEGGQAYGHGLYFAENPKVAAEYRKALTGGFKIDGVPYQDATTHNGATPGNYASAALSRFNGDIGAATKWLEQDNLPYEMEAAKMLKNAKSIEAMKGATYEVNLHTSPDELLDWDKPLSQQSPKVQESIKKHFPELIVPKTGQVQGDMNGEDIYQALVGPYGRQGHTEGTVSEKLKDAGIKGIQYLDQGSRAAGEGTKNFVIFDDKIIEIAKKYGVSLPVAASLYKWQQSQQGQ